MVLAELSRDITERFQQLGDRRILGSETEVRAGQSHFRQARADRRLTGDEGGTASRATLLSVPVGEEAPFLGDAIDVRRPVPHDAVVVGADVEPADVVAPDDEDIWFVTLRHLTLPSSWRIARRRGGNFNAP